MRNSSLPCVLVGGLGGDASGAAVMNVASFALSNLACLADFHTCHPIHLRQVATSTRSVLWVESAVCQAFAQHAPCIVFGDIYPKSGALTRELLYEVAANAIVITVSGGHLKGPGSADGLLPNCTGLEARWMAEVGYSTFRRPDGYVSNSYRSTYAYEHTPAYQATALWRTLTLLLSTQKLAAVTWYEIKDLPAGENVIGDVNNRNLGVDYVGWKPKPAEHALSFFNEFFMTPSRCIDRSVKVTRPRNSASEVHTFEMEDGSLAVVAWIGRIACWVLALHALYRIAGRLGGSRLPVDSEGLILGSDPAEDLLLKIRHVQESPGAVGKAQAAERIIFHERGLIFLMLNPGTESLAGAASAAYLRAYDLVFQLSESTFQVSGFSIFLFGSHDPDLRKLVA